MMGENIYKNQCKKCGIPMQRLGQFGTNIDDTVNTEFCRHCYLKGEFVNKEVSLEEKMAMNIAIVQKMGIARREAISLARTIIPKLKRWQT